MNISFSQLAMFTPCPNVKCPISFLRNYTDKMFRGVNKSFLTAPGLIFFLHLPQQDEKGLQEIIDLILSPNLKTNKKYTRGDVIVLIRRTCSKCK